MKNTLLIKILILSLVIAMAFSTVVSAVTFTDISNHWAKDWINRVAELKIVTGYEDGTFRPEKNVSVLESLIMMSRLYEIDEEIKVQIIEENKPKLEKISAASDYKWAFEGLSLILELGVVSESGLENMFKNKTITQYATKEEIAVLLTKTMMLGDEAKDLKVSILPFNDASEISSSAKPYIYVMYDKKILTGNNEKNINPKSNIKRAEMATMLDRAYSYIKDNDVEPNPENYKPSVEVKGIITEVTIGDVESYIYIQQDNKESTIVRINENTKIYLNDKKVNVSQIKKDMLIKCKIDEQRIAKIVEVDSLTQIVKGTISYVAFSPPAKIKINNENNKKTTYDIPSENIEIYIDGKSTELKNLEEDDLITLRMKNDVVYRIDSISRIQKYTGKITNINYENLPIKMTIKIKDKEDLMTFEYTSDVEVTRNDEKSSFDQVRVGDEVTVTTDYDEMIKVNTSAAEAQMKGTIKEILIAPQVKIKISDEDGELKEYLVSNSVKINLGTKNATIYDLRLGYQVNLNTSNNEIVTIEAAEIQTASNFTGKVIFVNTSDKLLMMQNINQNGKTELVYVRVVNSTKIFNISGDTKYIKDISEGKNIMTTVVTQGGEYVAVSIIIQ